MLPEIKKVTPERNNFPTRWQTVIFRNYRMAPTANIAKVLGCTSAEVEREALRMGLRAGTIDPAWLTKGYITIIRNNWHLLPYEQLCTLIGFTPERLEFAIEKDDFLGVKLGRMKPECETVKYSPLTDSELSQTGEIAKLVRKYNTSERVMFDFFTDTTDTEPQYVTSADKSIRMAHGFLTPCGDAFIEDTRSHLPDVLLDCYARQGVNALFVHGVLSSLSPYRFDPEMSRDYKLRRENLRDLIRRAALRGIKIYLYFNEPRALMRDVFEAYGKPEIGGRTVGSYVSLCLETEEPKEYLYSATRDLFEDIPEIGGIFNITMSENYTSCRSGGKKNCNCPRCAHLPNDTLPVLVNNIMHKAIRDAGSDAEVMTYAWGWSPARNWSYEEVDHAFKTLHPEISVMQVSENCKLINKGGVEYKISDYSISNPGPSDVSEYVLRTAAKYGHKLYAKVQMSCSWECSCVPYLPVFDIEVEHLMNLHKIGVDNVMLTWTLGGYPSITYDIVADYMSDPENFDIEKWYKKQFGDYDKTVHRAVKLFCDGFREYPFSVPVIYNSPKNLGPANLWSLEPRDCESTMVCYSFDDYEQWTNPYPIEVYLSQFEKLLTAWDEACDILESAAHDDKIRELALFARFAALQLHADVIHTKYARAKRELPASKEELRELLNAERELCRKQLSLMEKSSLIGYETSNHYFFTERNFIEKLVQVEQLLAEL
ncbi:MAG: hypothetical protein IJ428_07050 [Clostridia bacterium]|nr:hypothetical protein [Clostridia bacterium]MBQ8552550.1 hypothetical protein [Clostridia bacterium]